MDISETAGNSTYAEVGAVQTRKRGMEIVDSEYHQLDGRTHFVRIVDPSSNGWIDLGEKGTLNRHANYYALKRVENKSVNGGSGKPNISTYNARSTVLCQHLDYTNHPSTLLRRLAPHI